jgi:hypothetical protein
MEHKVTLPGLQELPTGRYPEPENSSPNPPSYFFKAHYFNIILLSTSMSSTQSFSFRFYHQTYACTAFLFAPYTCNVRQPSRSVLI